MKFAKDAALSTRATVVIQTDKSRLFDPVNY